MNKTTAFYTCLAALLDAGDEDLAEWFDKIFFHPSAPGIIDTASDDQGPIGPARMALQVAGYAAGEISMPPWMAAF